MVEELQFIRKAQALGFSLDEIGEILKLSRAGKTPCMHVLDLAKRHLAAVDDRIREGATHDVKREGNRIVSITWTKEIKARESASFVFLARNPAATR